MGQSWGNKGSCGKASGKYREGSGVAVRKNGNVMEKARKVVRK